MPYAKNGDIKIYYEVEGEGPPLVLHHGLGGDLESWRDNGHVDALKSDYTLIPMDARGHGKSDKPHTPEAYTMVDRAGDITAVLDDLGIEKSNFFGYSYGGRVAYELGKYAPDRIISLIIGAAGCGGPPPEWYEENIKLFQKGPEAVVATFEQQVGPLALKLKTRLLANDMKALIALMKQPWPDIRNELPNMTMPCLLFGGEADPALQRLIEVNKVLPDAKLVSFPGLDHMQAGNRLDLVVPMLKEFLARVNK